MKPIAPSSRFLLFWSILIAGLLFFPLAWAHVPSSAPAGADSEDNVSRFKSQSVGISFVVPPANTYSIDTHEHAQICDQDISVPYTTILGDMQNDNIDMAAQLIWGAFYPSDAAHYLNLVNDPVDGVTGQEHILTQSDSDSILMVGVETSQQSVSKHAHVSAFPITTAQANIFDESQDPACSVTHDGSGDYPNHALSQFNVNPNSFVYVNHQTWPVDLSSSPGTSGTFDWEAVKATFPYVGEGAQFLFGEALTFPDSLNHGIMFPAFASTDAALRRYHALETVHMGEDNAVLANGLESRFYGLYYKLLSAGIFISLVGGSDADCHDVDPLIAPRTYVQVGEGESFTVQSMANALKAGRASIASGPYQYLDLHVNGQPIGSRVEVASPSASVNAEAVLYLGDGFQIANQSIEILRDGEVVCSETIASQVGGTYTLNCTIPFSQSGWLAARTNNTAEIGTHTNATFVLVDQQPIAHGEEAEYFSIYTDYLNVHLDVVESQQGDAEELIGCSEDEARNDLSSARKIFSALRDYDYGTPSNVLRMDHSTASCVGYVGSGMKRGVNVSSPIALETPTTLTNFNAPPNASGMVLIGTHHYPTTPYTANGAEIFVGGAGGPMQGLLASIPVSSNEGGYAELSLTLDDFVYVPGTSYYVQWVWTNPLGCAVSGKVDSASDVLRIQPNSVPGFTPYGTPTTWSGGSPLLRAQNYPKLGSSNFGLKIHQAPPNAQGFMAVSMKSYPAGLFIPAYGATVYIDLTKIATVIPFMTNAGGDAFIPVPLTTTTKSGTIYAQATIMTPPGHPNVMSATNAAEIVFQTV